MSVVELLDIEYAKERRNDKARLWRGHEEKIWKKTNGATAI